MPGQSTGRYSGLPALAQASGIAGSGLQSDGRFRPGGQHRATDGSTPTIHSMVHSAREWRLAWNPHFDAIPGRKDLRPGHCNSWRIRPHLWTVERRGPGAGTAAGYWADSAGAVFRCLLSDGKTCLGLARRPQALLSASGSTASTRQFPRPHPHCPSRFSRASTALRPVLVRLGSRTSGPTSSTRLISPFSDSCIKE